MKIKTSKLTGAALDWAVAKCEGALGRIEIEQVNGVWAVAIPDLECYFEPSTDWSQGGPIIEREHLSVHPVLHLNTDVNAWLAHKIFIGTGVEGSTPLVAAMRCYVTSTLGNEIDIPEELL